MKVFIHRYTLSAKSPLNAMEAKADQQALSLHQGLLFKVEFTDGQVGYSSIHFHPSLGDITIEDFEASLKEQGVDYLLREHSQIILNAKIDAKNQWQEVLDNGVVKSHFTSTNPILSERTLEELQDKGFERIKVKIGATSDSFAKIINHYSKSDLAQEFDWIFDFNFSGNKEEILNFIKEGFGFDVYLEDPLSYDPEDWKELVEAGGKLLGDQVNYRDIITDGVGVEALVVKPTRIDMLLLLDTSLDYKIMVTSNLGEDIDLVTTCYWANYLQQKVPERFFGTGYLTQSFYKPTDLLEVAEEVFGDEPGLSRASRSLNVGWGKGEYLSEIEWTEV